MKSIKIIKTGAYIPEIKKENIEIENTVYERPAFGVQR